MDHRLPGTVPLKASIPRAPHAQDGTALLGAGAGACVIEALITVLGYRGKLGDPDRRVDGRVGMAFQEFAQGFRQVHSSSSSMPWGQCAPICTWRCGQPPNTQTSLRATKG